MPRPNKSRSIQDLSDEVNNIKVKKPFTIFNVEEKRDIDINNITLKDLANFVGTFIKDYKRN